MPVEKSCEINIQSEVLTSGSMAEIVNAIMEFLLYQRNQIPMVYPKYRYLVNRWSENEDNCAQSGKSLNNFQLERQRDLAKQTKDAISRMRQLISSTFERTTINRLRFLFGATMFTPKEAYTIHIPTEAIFRDHQHVHHPLPHAKLNQALISLLTNNELYTIFSHNLSPTNIYLELEILDGHRNCWNVVDSNTQISPKDFSKLPASCKNVHLHVSNSWPDEFAASQRLQCCKQLKVFEDQADDDRDLSEAQSEERFDNPTCTESTSSWWQADTVVRGFQEKPIKGVNMWLK